MKSKFTSILNYKPSRERVWYLTGICIAVVLTILENFLSPGPDANLYFGLGNNLLNGVGYIDNIRNDYILPPIGHPLLISLFSLIGLSGLLFNKIIFFAAIFFSFRVFRLAETSLLTSIILVFLIPVVLPSFIIYGVEVSLFLSSVLVVLTLLMYVSNYTLLNGILLGLSLFGFLIIRPLLLPALILCALIAVMLILFRKKMFRLLAPVLGIPIIALVITSAVSYSNYGDSRYTQGTYSAITLFCSFNEYIDLKATYYSDRWNEIPVSKREEGIRLLSIPDNGKWKDRDQILKREVTNFIIEHPKDAIEAFLWRLKKFSFGADGIIFRIVFYCWLLISIFSVFRIFSRPMSVKSKTLILFSLLLPAYIIGVQAIFVYCGSRYYVVPALFMIFGTVIMCKNTFLNKSKG